MMEIEVLFIYLFIFIGLMATSRMHACYVSLITFVHALITKGAIIIHHIAYYHWSIASYETGKMNFVG